MIIDNKTDNNHIQYKTSKYYLMKKWDNIRITKTVIIFKVILIKGKAN